MIWRMSANHHSDDSDRPNPAGIKNDSSTVIVLSNDETRSRQLVAALTGSSCADMSIQTGALTDDTGDVTREHTAMIILDAQDPTIDPLHALKRVRCHAPDAPLILVYSTTDALVASRALRAGATAFLATRELKTLFHAAVEKAIVGERFVSEEVMQGILHGMAEDADGQNRIPIEVLSDREMMVFQLLGKGKCPRNIADELGVNIKTVATHCNNIRRKLHTTDNRHLTRISQDWTASRSSHTTSGSTH